MNKFSYNDNGNIIEVTDNGFVYVNGHCVHEPLTDEQCDRYAAQIMNGEGYYNSKGKYISYGKD